MTINAKQLIYSLQDEHIEHLIQAGKPHIAEAAGKLGIDENYLAVNARVYLPYYTSEQIHNKQNSIPLVKEILAKLKNNIGDFQDSYHQHRKLNGVDQLPKNETLKLKDSGGMMQISASVKNIKVSFGIVPDDIGFNIQDKLHYIHNKRNDTIYHFGLFIEDYPNPICYCSISKCDRNYQSNSLAQTIDTPITQDSILVATRAFGFSPLPSNMMSKLFDNIARYIKNESQKNKTEKHNYIITALNPFLGFNGASFLGASFVPYATSPMEYKYNQNGEYLTRKTSSESVIKQSYTTPPILWLARPMTDFTRKKLENADKYYQISKDEYQRG